ncbi:DUF3427 domain-containing protein [Halobacillus ihumii]|uniref:DUF3427 domain-containing protein n=1 Tax=Halobacillus ihumii TaxID=2686092 RepID=UPI001F082264|nr:DUF3427 domain-containing protein [Halobacillus ihumii]
MAIKKLKPTGYWTFFCNPEKWAIDDFLESEEIYDYFAIRKSDKESFKIGDLAIIRVGKDRRTLEQLNGKERLKPGVYAIVQIIGEPRFMSNESLSFWADRDEAEKARFRVPIKYLHNLLDNPILLENLEELDIDFDPYLVDGFQGSSIPLKATTFNQILSKVQSDYTPFVVGEEYSRNDIYRIIEVPTKSQKGIWNTGYTQYNGDIFIFANINSAGRTGHDYDNKFIGDDLNWFSKNNHSLNTPSIKSMLNPEGNIYIFTREDSQNPYFIYQGNASVKDYRDTQPVYILWEFIDESENHPEKTTEEVTDPKKYKEGTTKQISVNVYERNPTARSKCIDHYGCSCVICRFNFEEAYGEIGKGFIHVHHLKELHEIGEEYEVDPIEDLRPVCPNCHAILHRRKPAYSIEDLQAKFSKNLQERH